jgi:hypothetical protein
MRKHFMLAGVVGATLSLFSCSKDMKTDQLRLENSAALTTAAAGSDELDAILKDLSPDTYLLSFDNLPVNNYITKAVYGNLSDEFQFCDPRYPSPVPSLYRLGYKTIPIKKIWIKTCPTMIPFKDIAARVAELLQKVDKRTFADLAVTEFAANQQILATKSFLTAANNLQPDAIDRVLYGKDLSKFRLTIPQSAALPAMTRGFYGTGDITQVAGSGARTTLTRYVGVSWKDVLAKKYPNLIGCFDPIVLRDIRASLINLDRKYAGLNLDEVAGGAILGIQ